MPVLRIMVGMSMTNWSAFRLILFEKLNFTPGSYTIGVRGICQMRLDESGQKPQSESLVNWKLISLPPQDYSGIPCIQIRFKVIGGTRPYKLLQGNGQFDSLTGDFYQWPSIMQKRLLFQIIDSNQCILTVSGRENCSPWFLRRGNANGIANCVWRQQYCGA